MNILVNRAASSGPMPSSAPCDSAPVPDPNLCQTHCSDHQQSGPTVLAPAPFAASFVAFLERDAASVLPEPPVAALAHPISPPLIVSHCCWRI